MRGLPFLASVWFLLLSAGCFDYAVVQGCADEPCCWDGRRSGVETDVDCGYMCKQGCGDGKHCVKDNDCGWGFTCVGEAVHERACRKQL